MVHALVDEAERLVAEGVEARLAAADAGAEAEAEADRRELLDSTVPIPTTPSAKDRAHPPSQRGRRARTVACAPMAKGAILTPRGRLPPLVPRGVAGAEMADNGPARGTMVIRPWGYASGS